MPRFPHLRNGNLETAWYPRERIRLEEGTAAACSWYFLCDSGQVLSQSQPQFPLVQSEWGHSVGVELLSEALLCLHILSFRNQRDFFQRSRACWEVSERGKWLWGGASGEPLFLPRPKRFLPALPGTWLPRLKLELREDKEAGEKLRTQEGIRFGAN